MKSNQPDQVDIVAMAVVLAIVGVLVWMAVQAAVYGG